MVCASVKERRSPAVRGETPLYWIIKTILRLGTTNGSGRGESEEKATIISIRFRAKIESAIQYLEWFAEDFTRKRPTPSLENIRG